MQYKSVTLTHRLVHKKANIDKISDEINEEYNKVIAEQAAQGWKFIGVHPVNIVRNFGCMDLLLACVCIFRCRKYQVDVLVFCRDDNI